MKKTISQILALALTITVFLSSFVMPVALAEESQGGDDLHTVTISDALFNLTKSTGYSPSNIYFWGNHESRIVHTSHGDYAAYVTELIQNTNGYNVIGFYIIKINEDGTTKLLFEDFRAYESSGVTIFADSNENLWVVEVGDSRIKTTTQTGVHVGAYRVDAKTDKVVGYTATYNVRQEGCGFGYGSAVYDPYTNKIIAETGDGDPTGKPNCGTINWFIFDVSTLKWEKTAHQVEVGSRFSYPYLVPDGKGGLYIIAGQDYQCESAGYPEIGDTRLPAGEKYTGYRCSEKQGSGYVWDSLHFFYIPDINVDEIKRIAVAEADYSRVLGTEEERKSLQYRISNLYSQFQNNNGGDVYLDSKGYLHVIWYKRYVYAALTGAEGESTHYHYVYDVRNLTSLDEFSEELLISQSKIKSQTEDNMFYSFRLYEDSKGDLYYISGSTEKNIGKNMKVQNITDGKSNTSTITVYLLEGTPETGYTHTPLVSKSNVTGGEIVNISNRSCSLNDDTVSLIIKGSNDYNYYTIDIDNQKHVVETDTDDNITLEGYIDASESGTVISVKGITNGEDYGFISSLLPENTKNFSIYNLTVTPILPNDKYYELSQPITMNYTVPSDCNADKLKAFFINEENALEEVNFTLDKESNVLSANVQKQGKYVFVEEKSEDSPITTPMPTETPVPGKEKTGFNVVGWIINVAVVAVLVIVVVILVKKRRR